MKRVLITGATGFVGSYLCEYLYQDGGWEIHGTAYGDGARINDWVKKVYELDLSNYENTKEAIEEIRPEYVVHLAALTSPAKSHSDQGVSLINNIMAQHNLLDAIRALKLKMKKILVIGSAEEYGMVRGEDNPINEKVELRPASPYAVSKVTQDYMGLQYFLAYQMPIVRVRPFNHTGPGQVPKFVVPDFAKQIAEIESGKREAQIRVGNLEAVRDFTDVRDMVKAYALALEAAEPGEVYNLGSGQGMKIADLLDRLLEMSDEQIEVVIDKSKFMPIDIPELVCDASKFRNACGWERAISLDETLSDVLNYWRKESTS